jgi:hypothetical protein
MFETFASLIEFRPLARLGMSRIILEFIMFIYLYFVVKGIMDGDKMTSPPVSIIGGLSTLGLP